MKIPSARKLMYQTGAMSDTTFSDIGVTNLVKDLSIVNRRGHDHTDSKGVPYNFRVAVTVYPQALDGTGYNVTANSDDLRTTIKFLTVPDNWVAKNAGIAWHQARNASMKRIGVKKDQLGAYAKTIRYNWDESATSFKAPVNGIGIAYAGGTWDTTKIFNAIDEDGFTLKLLGAGDDENDTIAGTDINALHSYLQSKATVLPDSNEHVSDVPSDRSLLLSTKHGFDSDADEVALLRAEVQNVQDNPPYDEFISSDTANDITEKTEAARIVMYPSRNAGGVSVVFNAPYGMFQMIGVHRDVSGDSNVLDSLAYSVEVLDIFPMQG